MAARAAARPRRSTRRSRTGKRSTSRASL
jgi:hypothetical protein